MHIFFLKSARAGFYYAEKATGIIQEYKKLQRVHGCLIFVVFETDYYFDFTSSEFLQKNSHGFHNIKELFTYNV